MSKIHLVVIDPQHDFCDPKGALSVPGALDAMNRVAKMVTRIGKGLADIHTTLDSHHFMHVAHPIYWKASDGSHPSPFTIISVADVKSGRWSTTVPSFHKKGLAYVENLEKNGRYPLCIWPPHCLIGSPGHAIVPELFAAYLEWEEKNLGAVNYVTKGSNYHTEHYSAVVADVVDPADPTTAMNTEFISLLQDAELILLGGIAGSHCLANTGRDIVQYVNAPEFVKKIVLLRDATAPVPGFENLQDDFFNDMIGLGAQENTTDKILV